MSDTKVLDEIERYCEAATEGPWVSSWDEEGPGESKQDDQWLIRSGKDRVVHLMYYDGENLACLEADARFIARARTDLPMLARLVRSVADAECSSGTWGSGTYCDERIKRFIENTNAKPDQALAKWDELACHPCRIRAELAKGGAR